MKKNSITSYTSPVANLLELELREGILEVSNGVNYSTTPGGAGGKDNYSTITSF